MLYAKVEKAKAQQIIKKIIASGCYADGFRCFNEGDYVFIPISKKPRGKWTLVEREGMVSKKKNVKDILQEKIGKENAELLYSSFDIVGDIAIVDFPENTEKYEKVLANAIMEVHRNVKVVAKKMGAVSGDFRVRPLKVIAGENRTETIYKEHGCKMKLDVAKVYFSVRLSAERKRIAEQVRPGEKILALFAGVGPFPLVIAKKQPSVEIVAIELNPVAVNYMQENISLNKVNNIIVEEGDAREIVTKKYRDYADRILMPLPKSADKFLDVAFRGAKNGCIVHIYGFGPENDPFFELEQKIKQYGNEKVKIINRKIVRPYAPRVVQVVIDFVILK
ncbi:MAG: class I SAM-dependent methyltransferase family protein [Candidatus Bilamarchaeaceae archaeon]